MRIIFLIILTLIFVPAAHAQETAVQPRNVKPPEIKQVYKEWSEKDVCWFIAGDPRDGYLKLQTDEEREKFIDEYWTSREKDPEYLSKNERIARTVYADEHFTVNILGSKTDRGRVYILWGKSDNTVYGRMRVSSREESVPFEIWTCDGRNFTFIDPDGTGDFRLIREEEKVK